MSAKKKHQYLAFNIKILKILHLWPEDGEDDKMIWLNRKVYYVFIFIMPTAMPVFWETFFVMAEPDADIVVKVQIVLAGTCIIGSIYMAICFLRNRKNIKALVDGIEDFGKFSDLNIIAVDAKASFHSKTFVTYSIIGILVYALSPFVSKKSCEEKQPRYQKQQGIACGVIVSVRLPVRYDETPVYEIYALHQMLASGTVTVIISNMTMMICGILEHAINQLKEVRKFMLMLSNCSRGEIVNSVHFIVKYHSAIIQFIDDLNEYFGSQLLVHFTLTSIVISVLGFEILMVNDMAESIRYAMHLIGWLVLLYMICHYGQLLIDESTGVAHDAYSTEWFNTDVKVQKDIKIIIMRSQKPLTLKALSLGVLSATTFLGVITSSYSYFTLLLKLKIS